MANDETKDQEKKAKVAAPCRSNLPSLAKGVTWDSVDIGDFEFRIAVATNAEGVRALAKGNDKVIAGLFNRALRIAVPQRLDARKLLDEAKTPEAKVKAAEDIQNAILDFDLTAIRVQGPKAPPKVTVPKGTPKAVVDSLIAQGVEVSYEV